MEAKPNAPNKRAIEYTFFLPNFVAIRAINIEKMAATAP